jgi:hypothetical protein
MAAMQHSRLCVCCGQRTFAPDMQVIPLYRYYRMYIAIRYNHLKLVCTVYHVLDLKSRHMQASLLKRLQDQQYSLCSSADRVYGSDGVDNS